MTDAQVDQPPSEPPPPPRARLLAADPYDRVVPLLSTEAPRRRTRKRGRALALARKLVVALVAAFVALLALAAVVDETEPGRSRTLSGSMR